MSIKYIFSINTGRSGSDYLTELLSMAVNAVSIHEGLPIMNGIEMQQFNNGDSSALRRLMPLKLKEILKKNKNGQKVYCETNHSYIKGWGYLIPDEYIPQEELGVVILRRTVEKTVYSLLRVHEAPGVSEWSRTWYLQSGAQRNLSCPPENAGLYDICKWYVEEVRLRAEDYKKKFPRITYFECELEQLNDFDFVLDMFNTFGLVPSSELKDTCGKILNTRNEWPKLPIDLILSPSKYPSADDLSPEERDTLVANMVDYLYERKADKISAAKPDFAMGGTLASAATGIVAYAEQELEHFFQYSLMFTETERVLIGEFLRLLSPNDFMFIALNRTPKPGIAYTYDFNIVLSVETMIHKLGFMGLFKMIWMIISGLWGKDYSHREAN